METQRWLIAGTGPFNLQGMPVTPCTPKLLAAATTLRPNALLEG